jgi:hypothetical protein
VFLAFLVVHALSSHSAVNVPTPFLDCVSLLMGRLVLMVRLCPVTTFPVKEVTGVALLTAAKITDCCKE